VPWIRAGGEVQRDVTANPKRCCVQNSVLLSGPVLPGLERPVCDRSHGPGTGLAQRDRLQACPRVRRRRRAQPARPQHEGCTKSAQDGGTPHCKAHGEGKRCHQVGCAKSALGDTKRVSRMVAGGAATTRAAARRLLQAARRTRRMEAAGGASTRAAANQLLQAARPTSDELTVLYSNGPDDRSVKLALGYVTAATSGC
jgi:hypothetical protein